MMIEKWDKNNFWGKKAGNFQYDSDWHIGNLPNFTNGSIFDYPSNEECVIILPVYSGGQDHYQSSYLKSAFWAAHSLVLHSNVKELGYKIVFFLQDLYMDAPEVAPLLEISGVPETNIFRYSREKPWQDCTAQWGMMGQHMFPLLESWVYDYARVWLWDSDLFVVADTDTAPLQIDQLSEIGHPYGLWLFRKADKPIRVEHFNRSQKYPPFDGEEIIKKWHSLLSAYLGYTWECLYDCSAFIHLFEPARIPKDLPDFVRETEPLFSDDEVMPILYAMRTGFAFASINRLWKIGTVLATIDEFLDYVTCDCASETLCEYHRNSSQDLVDSQKLPYPYAEAYKRHFYPPNRARLSHFIAWEEKGEAWYPRWRELIGCPIEEEI